VIIIFVVLYRIEFRINDLLAVGLVVLFKPRQGDVRRGAPLVDTVFVFVEGIVIAVAGFNKETLQPFGTAGNGYQLISYLFSREPI
jgi:hypothetical protein